MIFSTRLPTASDMLIVVDSVIRTGTLCKTVVLKLSADTSIWYSPAGSKTKERFPASSVTTFHFSLVASLTAWTSAPTITRPEESFTTPVILPVVWHVVLSDAQTNSTQAVMTRRICCVPIVDQAPISRVHIPFCTCQLLYR